MKKLIVFLAAALALAVPAGVALAKAPATHTNHSHAAPKVMYVLKGTLSGYVAPTSPTSDGQIWITVTHSNFHARALKNATQPVGPFAVSTKTRITFPNGATQISDGAKGVLKFRAPLRFATGTDLATTLPTTAKALHIIDLAHS